MVPFFSVSAAFPILISPPLPLVPCVTSPLADSIPTIYPVSALCIITLSFFSPYVFPLPLLFSSLLYPLLLLQVSQVTPSPTMNHSLPLKYHAKLSSPLMHPSFPLLRLSPPPPTSPNPPFITK